VMPLTQAAMARTLHNLPRSDAPNGEDTVHGDRS
jgi:hypothetical protein